MAWVQVSLRAGARRPGCDLSPGAPALLRVDWGVEESGEPQMV